jgi:hypothetical protein
MQSTEAGKCNCAAGQDRHPRDRCGMPAGARMRHMGQCRGVRHLHHRQNDTPTRGHLACVPTATPGARGARSCRVAASHTTTAAARPRPRTRQLVCTPAAADGPRGTRQVCPSLLFAPRTPLQGMTTTQLTTRWQYAGTQHSTAPGAKAAGGGGVLRKQTQGTTATRHTLELKRGCKPPADAVQVMQAVCLHVDTPRHTLEPPRARPLQRAQHRSLSQLQEAHRQTHGSHIHRQTRALALRPHWPRTHATGVVVRRGPGQDMRAVRSTDVRNTQQPFTTARRHSGLAACIPA